MIQSINNKYIALDNNIYKLIEKGNKTVSLCNIISNMYIRHYCGNIKENVYEEKNNIFLQDSTFKYIIFGKYIILQCTNKNLVSHYICYSKSNNKFLISKKFNENIFIYKFIVYDNLESVSISETYNDNISIQDKINIEEKKLSLDVQSVISDDSELYSYNIINKIKENTIKAKAQSKKKLIVLFIISYQAKFGFESMYKYMIDSSLFEPYIFVISAKDKLFKNNKQYYNDSYNSYLYFKNSGYRTIFAYKNEQGDCISIDELNPDLIIYNNPNISNQSKYQTLLLNKNYLVCFFPYGMSVVNHFSYQYENKIINSAWKNFCSTNYTYLMNIEKSKFKGINAVNLGYPKLDIYNSKTNKNNIPPKILKADTNIIIAPHWSYKTSDNLATFHLYAKLFITLKNTYKNINFIFKPHPDLVNRIIQNKDNILMSYNEYKEYINDWENSENGLYFEGGNYIDIFKSCSLMITDCGSFIAEYLPVNKPCIFLVNPDKLNFFEGFNEYGREILETYYLAYNEDDIVKYFKLLVLDKNDEKADARKKLLDTHFVNFGCAGKKIVEYLENIFLDRSPIDNYVI